MDIWRALGIVNSSLHLPGESDATLSTAVAALAPAAVPLVPVPGLHGGAQVRIADVLLRLTQATRPKYQADVYDVHAHWGLLRYLGVFDSRSSAAGDQVHLSDAGRRVVGNQRRVLSEELGIGFSVLLAESWSKSQSGSSSTPRVVDIDVALQDAAVSVGGLARTVAQTGSSRPDYILLSDESTRRGRFRVSVLESKGTKSKPNRLPQLARASTQLTGVQVGGRVPPGLAVSTVLGDGAVTYSALQTAPIPRLATHPSPASEGTEVELDVERIEESDLGFGMDIDDARADLLVAAALKSSWASLGDYSGNDAAFRRWAPRVLRRKYDRGADAQRTRQSVRTAGGTELVGVATVLTLPGGQLDAFMGLDSRVDEALTFGRSEDVLAVQEQLRAEDVRGRAARERSDEVVALAEDGAGLIFRGL